MESKSGSRPVFPSHTHTSNAVTTFFCSPTFPTCKIKLKQKKKLKNKKKKKGKVACIQASPVKGHDLKKNKIVTLLPQIKCKNQAVSRYTHIHTHGCVHVYILNNNNKKREHRQNCPFSWLFAATQRLLHPGQGSGHLHETCVPAKRIELSLSTC